MHHETAFDRFLKIKNYSNTKEVLKWLKKESDRMKDGMPKKYKDMLSLSLLSDFYYQNTPEEVQREIFDICEGNPPSLICAFEAYRIAESRMVAMATWSDTVQEQPDADRVRKYLYSLIEDHHEKGWDIGLSTVMMEEEEPEEYGMLTAKANNEDLDEFEADMLYNLCNIFNDFGEEKTLQIFFSRPGQPTEKAIILVNCIWGDATDGYEECTPGPFVISGTAKGNIKLIAPEDIGLQVLSGSNTI